MIQSFRSVIGVLAVASALLIAPAMARADSQFLFQPIGASPLSFPADFTNGTITFDSVLPTNFFKADTSDLVTPGQLLAMSMHAEIDIDGDGDAAAGSFFTISDGGGNVYTGLVSGVIAAANEFAGAVTSGSWAGGSDFGGTGFDLSNVGISGGTVSTFQLSFFLGAEVVLAGTATTGAAASTPMPAAIWTGLAMLGLIIPARVIARRR